MAAPISPAPDNKAILPIVHLNGTGRSTLFREWDDALLACEAAERKLQHATLHARDFYPRDDDLASYYAARAQRDAQLAKLQEVADYLRQIVTHLDPRFQG